MPSHKVQKKKRKVLLGDKVFAKIVGYPPWPARVTKLQKCEGTSKKYHVIFYGTLQTGVIRLENIYSYEEYAEKCNQFFGRKGYKDSFISMQKDLRSKQQVKITVKTSIEPVVHAKKFSTTGKNKPKLKADKLLVKNGSPIVSKQKASKKEKLKVKKVIQDKSKHAGASKVFKKVVLASKIQLSGKLPKRPKKVIKASVSKSEKSGVLASKRKSSEKLLAGVKKVKICNKKLKNATKKDVAKQKLSSRPKPKNKSSESVGFFKKVKTIITVRKGITVSKRKIKSEASKKGEIKNEKVLKKQKQVITKSEPLVKSKKLCLQDKKSLKVNTKLKSVAISKSNTVTGLKSVKTAKLSVFKIPKKLPPIQKTKKKIGLLTKYVQTSSNSSEKSVKSLKNQRIIASTDNAQRQSTLPLKSHCDFTKIKTRAYKSEDDNNIHAFSFSVDGLLNHIEVKKPRNYSDMSTYQRSNWERNAMNATELLQSRIEDGTVSPDCGPKYQIDYLENKMLSIKTEDRAPLSVFTTEHKERVWAVMKYFQLVQYDLDIQTCLPLEGPPRFADCLYTLDEVLAIMQFDELLLKKYPDFVQTVKVLCIYEGKLDEWNLEEEEVNNFKKDVREIREKGNELFTIIKNIFGTDDDTFDKVFNSKVKQFKKSVAKMSYEDLCLLAEDPVLELDSISLDSEDN